MSSTIDYFYDFHKDVVTNTSTGLMAIKDLATYYGIPIDIHFTDHRIEIHIGSERISIYCQDMYKQFGESDNIYHWIANAIERVKGEK